MVVGGRAAKHHPELVERLGGHYLGNDPRLLAETLAPLLKEMGVW